MCFTLSPLRKRFYIPLNTTLKRFLIPEKTAFKPFSIQKRKTCNKDHRLQNKMTILEKELSHVGRIAQKRVVIDIHLTFLSFDSIIINM